MAVKARILLWAMQEFPEEENFIYLDSDVFAYSRFEELEVLMPRSEIVLTPHHLHDEESPEGVRDNMLRTLLCGTFNSGFVAMRRTPAAEEFLRWWDRKLRNFCYKDHSLGLYCEQRWLDLAVSLFNITVLREPGYNVANWNAGKRLVDIVRGSSTYVVNDGRPLRFFHWSMSEYGRDLYYFWRYLPADSPVFHLRRSYLKKVRGLDSNGQSRIPWSYDSYSSGQVVAQEVRQSYRNNALLAAAFPNPFGQSNAALVCAEAEMSGYPRKQDGSSDQDKMHSDLSRPLAGDTPRW